MEAKHEKNRQENCRLLVIKSQHGLFIDKISKTLTQITLFLHSLDNFM